MSSVSILAHHIRTHGPIKTARVSSAQAKGAAKKYCYWGAVRYEIRLTAAGLPSNIALERASSDRRSQRLAAEDCESLCEREDRIECPAIGRITEFSARAILSDLGYAEQIAKTERRAVTTTDPLLAAAASRRERAAKLRTDRQRERDEAAAAILRSEGLCAVRRDGMWEVSEPGRPYYARVYFMTVPTAAEARDAISLKHAIVDPTEQARKHLGLPDSMPLEIAADYAEDHYLPKLADAMRRRAAVIGGVA
jgi:hypothetical protein